MHVYGIDCPLLFCLDLYGSVLYCDVLFSIVLLLSCIVLCCAALRCAALYRIVLYSVYVHIVCMYILYVCMNVCMNVCLSVCMYVCWEVAIRCAFTHVGLIAPTLCQIGRSIGISGEVKFCQNKGDGERWREQEEIIVTPDRQKAHSSAIYGTSDMGETLAARSREGPVEKGRSQTAQGVRELDRYVCADFEADS